MSILLNKNYKHIDSMCTLEKINFVYSFTKSSFKNHRVIVEIGTFFGAITQALRLSIENDKVKIITCDFFRWDDDKQKKYPNKGYKYGDDFSKEVINNLSHLSNVEIYKTDFTNLKINEKIDLMFVDAPKRNKYVIDFINIFSKFWIANHTKILFEDYNQFFSYELPATLHPINHHFKFYSDKSGIVVGEVKSNEFLNHELKKMNIREWSKNEIIKNWNEIINTGDNKKYLEKDISIFMHLFDNGFIEEAKKYAKEKKINFEKYSIKQKFVKRYIDTKKQKKHKKFINLIKKNKILRKINSKIKFFLKI
jgi:hypothetical protein